MAFTAFDAPDGSLRARATSGVVKTGMSQVIRLFVQFTSAIVLSRLLVPAEFGIIAMAGPVAAFTALFQDLGLSQAIVQKQTLTQAEVSTLFFVGLGMSIALAAILAAVSPLVVLFYNEPRVGLLTAALGVNVVVGGAGSFHQALLNRRMRFGVLASIDVLAALGGLLASATFALMFHSFWALYAGSLAMALIPTAGYWIATGWRPSLPRRRSGAGVALHFGANVTGFNVANFFSRNLDNVLIGRVWGENPLGLYDRAYKLLLLPLQQINAPISKIMLPVLSRMTDDPQRYSQAYLRTLAQMLLVTLPGIAFMIGTSDLLIPLLLGRQWTDASAIFAVLGIASFVQILNNPTGWLFISQGRTREYMYWGLFSSATTVLSFVIGLPHGPVGVATAYAVGEYIRTPLVWWYVTRRGPIAPGNVVRMALPHFVGIPAALLAIMWLRAQLVAPTPVLLAAALVTSFAVSLLVVAAFPHGREAIGQSVGLVRRPLQRRIAS